MTKIESKNDKQNDEVRVSTPTTNKSSQDTPRTADSSLKPLTATTNVNTGEYFPCLRAMCEHDEGWHLAESFVPLPNQQSMDPYAAYLARVMTIVKSGSMASETRIFFNDTGLKLIAEIQNKAVNGDKKDLADSYLALRTFFTSEVEARRCYSLVPANKGLSDRLELEFCELKNGKRMWLCPNHVQQTNATVVRGDSSRGSTLGQNGSIYAKMLEIIQQEI